MLIVGRRQNQTVRITMPDGRFIYVGIERAGIEGGQVHLGFTAPWDVRIDRLEVALARDRETQAPLGLAGGIPPRGRTPLDPQISPTARESGD